MKTLEECSDAELVEVSRLRKLPTLEEKNLLTIAHDYFSNFKHRLQATKRTTVRDDGDLTGTLD